MKVTNNSVVAPVVTRAQPTAAEIERANQRATIVKVLKATLVVGVAATVAAVAYAFSAGKVTPTDTTIPDVITPDTKPDTTVAADETMWPLIGKVVVTVAGLVGLGLTAKHYTSEEATFARLPTPTYYPVMATGEIMNYNELTAMAASAEEARARAAAVTSSLPKDETEDSFVMTSLFE